MENYQMVMAILGGFFLSSFTGMAYNLYNVVVLQYKKRLDEIDNIVAELKANYDNHIITKDAELDTKFKQIVSKIETMLLDTISTAKSRVTMSNGGIYRTNIGLVDDNNRKKILAQDKNELKVFSDFLENMASVLPKPEISKEPNPALNAPIVSLEPVGQYQLD